MNRAFAVIGGGLAGIAAAVSLGQRGHDVTLIERRSTLGGRASAFSSDGAWVDNCQHVILGCCTELLRLLKDLGTDKFIRFYPAIPFYAENKTTKLRPSRLPSPFHFLPGFLAAPMFSWKEKWSILRLFSKLWKTPPDPDRLDKLTILDWLRREKQPDSAIRKFWELILVSTLNETLDRASAKYGAMMIRESFLTDRNASLFGVPDVPLHDLYHEGAETLFNRYKVKRIQGAVNALGFEGERRQVYLDQEQKMEFDSIISAVPFYNLMPILPPQIRENEFFSKVKNLDTSPILGIHYWFKRALTRERFGAFPLSPIHWFFTHPSREDAFYVELVVSACRPLLDSTNNDIIRLGLKELARSFPEAAEQNLLKSIVVRETRATFSITPGSDRFRLPQSTPVSNFYLAGDWTDTGWPATMEGAVRSGYRAAELAHGQGKSGIANE